MGTETHDPDETVLRPAPQIAVDPRELPTAPPPALRPARPNSLPTFEHEVRDLLDRRLRIVFLILGLLGGYLFLVSRLRVSDYLSPGSLGPEGGFLLAATCLVTLGSAAVIHLRPPLSLRQLRFLEVAGFSLLAAAIASWNLRLADVLGPNDFEGPGHVTAHRGFVIFQGSLAWFVAVVCYGVFIPNTLRRAAIAVGVLAGLGVSLDLITLAEWWPVPVDQLLMYFGSRVAALSVASSVALFGTYKLASLQREAIRAREEAWAVGPYRLVRPLGGGGMGDVYLAEHRLLKRPCAVKLIRPTQAGDPGFLARFEREVQVTARLTHPNTVEVFDYGTADDGSLYYVMEYLPGMSLADLVNRHGPLPPGRAVHFLVQVCGALREAHLLGLVHRDVKPANVLACVLGGRHDVAKLLDFGLVRTPDIERDSTRLTQHGMILGTPEYMAPEQARGDDGPVGPAGDLYSLGATAYFLLAGVPPFRRVGVLPTLMAHLRDEVPPLPATVPADLAAVVLRCLAKEPAGRPADADALEKQLLACACAGTWTEADAAAWWVAVGRPGGRRAER